MGFLTILKKRRKLLIALGALVIIAAVSVTGIIVRTMNAGRAEQTFTGDPSELVNVGFVASATEPNDEQIKRMLDEVIRQILGERGLSAIIKPGDKVVIKVNIVSPHLGKKGEKGRGIITDPRVVRYIAEEVRTIIGFDGTADLKVIDATHYPEENPSLTRQPVSFYWARLERTGDNNVDPEDVCYDENKDGILDGASQARLINPDSINLEGRFWKEIEEPTLGLTKVYLPKFLRTKEEAGDSDEYCDVFLGLPVWKGHGFTGLTGAIKLHYGLRYRWPVLDEGGREDHSGYGWGTGNIQLLLDYLCAQHKVRTYDLLVMDCLTGDRSGNLNINPEDPDSMTDYILGNVFLCAKDPVAMDTAATLLAGYDQHSIPLLHTAYLDGLGTDKPEYINIIGLTRFCDHRTSLFIAYNPVGRYPFRERVGGTALMRDFDGPKNVTLSEPVFLNDTVCRFTCTAEEKDLFDTGLARVDFLVNGKVIKYFTGEALNSGNLEVDVSAYQTQAATCRIAVWDKAFNCVLSEERTLPSR